MSKPPTIVEMCDKFLTETSNTAFPGFRHDKPVTPKERAAPIIPQNRWIGTKVGQIELLEKNFVFNTISERNDFVIESLEVEDRYQHTASTLINGLTVTIRLYTKNVNLPTEVDVKISRYLDSVYADTAFKVEE